MVKLSLRQSTSGGLSRNDVKNYSKRAAGVSRSRRRPERDRLLDAARRREIDIIPRGTYRFRENTMRGTSEKGRRDVTGSSR